MSLNEKRTVAREPEFEFRLRPVATPKGFKYHVEARRAGLKYSPVWHRITGLPLSKAEATKLTSEAEAVGRG